MRQRRWRAAIWIGREVLQRSVEQVGECDGALTRGSWGGVVHGHGLVQSPDRPSSDRGPDHRERQDMPSARSMAASRIEVSSSRSTFLLLVTAFHCRQSSVSWVSSRTGWRPLRLGRPRISAAKATS